MSEPRAEITTPNFHTALHLVELATKVLFSSRSRKRNFTALCVYLPLYIYALAQKGECIRHRCCSNKAT